MLWSGGNRDAPIDVWFHPAFGDSTASFRHAFKSSLARCARLFVHDPPGHGASPPRSNGLSLTDCALLWCNLVAQYSRSRRVVLVGHSMAGVIASLTAARLRSPPDLVIAVEGNLTRSDAYFSGLATQFEDPSAFHRSLLAKIRLRGKRDECFRRFAASLVFADPLTLWTLGRSVYADKDPGAAFRRLNCPGIYYWDATRSSRSTRGYIEQYKLPNRRLDHLGHWPMIKGPDAFYAAVAEDIRTRSGKHEVRSSPRRVASLLLI